MELLWLFYNGSKPRHILLLELGRTDTKIIGIESNKIKVGEKNRLKSASTIIDNLSLDKKIIWIKHNCPGVMAGLRTLFINKSNVINNYKFK